MHLAQPALPDMRRNKKFLSGAFQHYTHQNAGLTATHTAESEEDEHISEADRDARLAYVSSIHSSLSFINLVK